MTSYFPTLTQRKTGDDYVDTVVRAPPADHRTPTSGPIAGATFDAADVGQARASGRGSLSSGNDAGRELEPDSGLDRRDAARVATTPRRARRSRQPRRADATRHRTRSRRCLLRG